MDKSFLWGIDMRLVHLAIALASLLGITAFAVADEAPNKSQPKEITKASKEEIGRLIKQLGDEEFASRAQARKKLEEIGEPALGILKETAEKSGDAEIKNAATAIVEVLEKKLGITAEKQLRALAARLHAPIGEIEKADIALPFLLETLGFLASPDGSVKIQINEKAFNDVTKGQFDAERVQIKFQRQLKNVPLKDVLDIICRQISAGYMQREDRVEILPIETIRKELKLPEAADGTLARLVIQFYDKVTLESALEDLAKRYGRKIVRSDKAEKQLKKTISARLINLPFESAVQTLANMADLGVARMGNDFVVTTKEHAATLKAESPKK
jgi:hypothetical protein